MGVHTGKVGRNGRRAPSGQDGVEGSVREGGRGRRGTNLVGLRGARLGRGRKRELGVLRDVVGGIVVVVCRNGQNRALGGEGDVVALRVNERVGEVVLARNVGVARGAVLAGGHEPLETQGQVALCRDLLHLCGRDFYAAPAALHSRGRACERVVVVAGKRNAQHRAHARAGLGGEGPVRSDLYVGDLSRRARALRHGEGRAFGHRAAHRGRGRDLHPHKVVRTVIVADLYVLTQILQLAGLLVAIGVPVGRLCLRPLVDEGFPSPRVRSAGIYGRAFEKGHFVGLAVNLDTTPAIALLKGEVGVHNVQGPSVRVTISPVAVEGVNTDVGHAGWDGYVDVPSTARPILREGLLAD